MLNGMGIEHDIDLEKLVKAGDFIVRQLGRQNDSGVARAMLAKINNE